MEGGVPGPDAPPRGLLRPLENVGMAPCPAGKQPLVNVPSRPSCPGERDTAENAVPRGHEGGGEAQACPPPRPSSAVEEPPNDDDEEETIPDSDDDDSPMLLRTVAKTGHWVGGVGGLQPLLRSPAGGSQAGSQAVAADYHAFLVGHDGGGDAGIQAEEPLDPPAAAPLPTAGTGETESAQAGAAVAGAAEEGAGLLYAAPAPAADIVAVAAEERLKGGDGGDDAGEEGPEAQARAGERRQGPPPGRDLASSAGDAPGGQVTEDGGALLVIPADARAESEPRAEVAQQAYAATPEEATEGAVVDTTLAGEAGVVRAAGAMEAVQAVGEEVEGAMGAREALQGVQAGEADVGEAVGVGSVTETATDAVAAADVAGVDAAEAVDAVDAMEAAAAVPVVPVDAAGAVSVEAVAAEEAVAGQAAVVDLVADDEAAEQEGLHGTHSASLEEERSLDQGHVPGAGAGQVGVGQSRVQQGASQQPAEDNAETAALDVTFEAYDAELQYGEALAAMEDEVKRARSPAAVEVVGVVERNVHIPVDLWDFVPPSILNKSYPTLVMDLGGQMFEVTYLAAQKDVLFRDADHASLSAKLRWGDFIVWQKVPWEDSGGTAFEVHIVRRSLHASVAEAQVAARGLADRITRGHEEVIAQSKAAVKGAVEDAAAKLSAMNSAYGRERMLNPQGGHVRLVSAAGPRHGGGGGGRGAEAVERLGPRKQNRPGSPEWKREAPTDMGRMRSALQREARKHYSYLDLSSPEEQLVLELLIKQKVAFDAGPAPERPPAPSPKKRRKKKSKAGGTRGVEAQGQEHVVVDSSTSSSGDAGSSSSDDEPLARLVGAGAGAGGGSPRCSPPPSSLGVHGRPSPPAMPELDGGGGGRAPVSEGGRRSWEDEGEGEGEGEDAGADSTGRVPAPRRILILGSEEQEDPLPRPSPPESPAAAGYGQPGNIDGGTPVREVIVIGSQGDDATGRRPADKRKRPDGGGADRGVEMLSPPRASEADGDGEGEKKKKKKKKRTNPTASLRGAPGDRSANVEGALFAERSESEGGASGDDGFVLPDDADLLFDTDVSVGEERAPQKKKSQKKRQLESKRREERRGQRKGKEVEEEVDELMPKKTKKPGSKPKRFIAGFVVGDDEEYSTSDFTPPTSDDGRERADRRKKQPKENIATIILTKQREITRGNSGGGGGGGGVSPSSSGDDGSGEDMSQEHSEGGSGEDMSQDLGVGSGGTAELSSDDDILSAGGPPPWSDRAGGGLGGAGGSKRPRSAGWGSRPGHTGARKSGGGSGRKRQSRIGGFLGPREPTGSNAPARGGGGARAPTTSGSGDFQANFGGALQPRVGAGDSDRPRHAPRDDPIEIPNYNPRGGVSRLSMFSRPSGGAAAPSLLPEFLRLDEDIPAGLSAGDREQWMAAAAAARGGRHPVGEARALLGVEMDVAALADRLEGLSGVGAGAYSALRARVLELVSKRRRGVDGEEADGGRTGGGAQAPGTAAPAQAPAADGVADGSSAELWGLLQDAARAAGVGELSRDCCAFREDLEPARDGSEGPPSDWRGGGLHHRALSPVVEGSPRAQVLDACSACSGILRVVARALADEKVMNKRINKCTPLFASFPLKPLSVPAGPVAALRHWVALIICVADALPAAQWRWVAKRFKTLGDFEGSGAPARRVLIAGGASLASLLGEKQHALESTLPAGGAGEGATAEERAAEAGARHALTARKEVLGMLRGLLSSTLKKQLEELHQAEAAGLRDHAAEHRAELAKVSGVVAYWMARVAGIIASVPAGRPGGWLDWEEWELVKAVLCPLPPRLVNPNPTIVAARGRLCAAALAKLRECGVAPRDLAAEIRSKPWPWQMAKAAVAGGLAAPKEPAGFAGDFEYTLRAVAWALPAEVPRRAADVLLEAQQAAVRAFAEPAFSLEAATAGGGLPEMLSWERLPWQLRAALPPLARRPRGPAAGPAPHPSDGDPLSAVREVAVQRIFPAWLRGLRGRANTEGARALALRFVGELTRPLPGDRPPLWEVLSMAMQLEVVGLLALPPEPRFAGLKSAALLLVGSAVGFSATGPLATRAEGGRDWEWHSGCGDVGGGRAEQEFVRAVAGYCTACIARSAVKLHKDGPGGAQAAFVDASAASRGSPLAEQLRRLRAAPDPERCEAMAGAARPGGDLSRAVAALALARSHDPSHAAEDQGIQDAVEAAGGGDAPVALGAGDVGLAGATLTGLGTKELALAKKCADALRALLDAGWLSRGGGRDGDLLQVVQDALVVVRERRRYGAKEALAEGVEQALLRVAAAAESPAWRRMQAQQPRA